MWEKEQQQQHLLMDTSRTTSGPPPLNPSSVQSSELSAVLLSLSFLTLSVVSNYQCSTQCDCKLFVSL